MKHFVKYLLFPPTCAGCGERFDVFAEEEIPAFCLKCRVAWEAAVTAPCELCGRALSKCTCMPELLRQSGCSELHKLCRYEPERRKRIGTHTVLTLKDRRVTRVFDFLGSELAHGLLADNAVVTYVPRSREGASRAGFDQGKELARALAKHGGYPFLSLFFRRGGAEQKLLTAEERLANVRCSVSLRREYRGGELSSLAGKTVLLVDDVVTTGATMAVCTGFLLAAGAARVVGVSVAVDFRGEDTNSDDTD